MSEHFDKLGWLDFFLRGAHDLSHAEFRVLTILFSYSSSKDGGEIRPGLSRIIKDCCISRNTAKAALKTLQDKGYIIQVRAGGNQTGKGYANVYQLGRPEHRTSYPQGDQPLTPRGPTIDTKGTNHWAPTQAYTQGCNQANGYTTDSHESADHTITPEQRNHLINSMLNVAAVKADPNHTRDELLDLEEEHEGLLLEYLPDDYQDNILNRGYSHVPAKVHNNPYEAGKRLNIILNSLGA